MYTIILVLLITWSILVIIVAQLMILRIMTDEYSLPIWVEIPCRLPLIELSFIVLTLIVLFVFSNN